jgi:hypothetical protein
MNTKKQGTVGTIDGMGQGTPHILDGARATLVKREEHVVRVRLTETRGFFKMGDVITVHAGQWARDE